eukprot:15389204-Alexandrium_andersonii.AAC.1
MQLPHTKGPSTALRAVATTAATHFERAQQPPRAPRRTYISSKCLCTKRKRVDCTSASQSN